VAGGEREDHVIAADVVHGRYGSRALELASRHRRDRHHAYIALQLIGIAAVVKALGLSGELPLIVAFAVLGRVHLFPRACGRRR